MEAFGYLRISTKTNASGDGWRRQEDAVTEFAETKKIHIIGIKKEIWTGTEADRPEFSELLRECHEGGVGIIIIESADRLARDLMVQLQLLAICKKSGIKVIAANTGMDLTDDSDPMRKTIYSVMGAMAEYEKSALVLKLAKARNALSETQGCRIEGRKRAVYSAELVEKVFKLRKKPRNQKRMSLRAIADRLNAEGIRTTSGRLMYPNAIKAILKTTKQVKTRI